MSSGTSDITVAFIVTGILINYPEILDHKGLRSVECEKWRLLLLCARKANDVTRIEYNVAMCVTLSYVCMRYRGTHITYNITSEIDNDRNKLTSLQMYCLHDFADDEE